MVFVLSPDAVASEVAQREVAFAASLNKRFAPIVYRRAEDKQVPAPLAKLRFIFFDDASQFEDKADQLAQALGTDIVWVRQHTDFGDQARKWSTASEPSGLLLRSPVLEQAERWIAGRPSGAAAPTEDTQRFIRRSRQGATRRRNILTGSLAAGLVLAIGLAGLAYWQRGVAVEQRVIAVQAEQTATEQKEIAQQQRDRAEKTLATASKTANDLVFNLAQEFRDQTGMPVQLTRRILDRTRALQKQLTESGETSPDLQRTEVVALGELGLTLLAQGDAHAALAAAERSRELTESLVSRDPSNKLWQGDLNISYSRLGDALRAVGRRADALVAYQKALSTSEKLAVADPTDRDAHRGLSIDYQRLGNVLRDIGSREEALVAYRKALAVLEQFGEPDPDWQWGMANNHANVGEMLQVGGRREEALDEFRTDVELMKKVVLAQLGNVRAQRDLATAYEKLGHTFMELGRLDQAVEAHEASVRIAEQVAGPDPGNVERQANLASTYEMYFLSLRKTDRPQLTKEVLQKLVAIREKNAHVDPDNTRWQHHLAIGYIYLGDSLSKDEDSDQALAIYRKTLSILTKLNAIDPENVDWRHDLSVTSSRIAVILYKKGQVDDALKLFEQDLRLEQQAAAADPGNILFRRGLGVSNFNVAEALFGSGRVEEALTYFDEAIRIKRAITVDPDPENVAIAHLHRAEAFFYLNQPEAALADLEAAAKLYPEGAYTLLWLQMTRMRLHQSDLEDLAKRASVLERTKWPWPLVAFYLGQMDSEAVRAAALSSEKAGTRDEQVCEAEFYIGVHRLENGDRPEALRVLQSAIDKCQTEPQHRILAARLQQQLNGMQPAESAASIAIAQCNGLAASPLDSERPKSVAGVPVGAINATAAVTACMAAVRAAPEDRRMLYQLGRAYDAAKDYAKARDFYARAAELGHTRWRPTISARSMTMDAGWLKTSLQLADFTSRRLETALRSQCQTLDGCINTAAAAHRTTRRRTTGMKRLQPRDLRWARCVRDGSIITAKELRRIRSPRSAGMRRPPRPAMRRRCERSDFCTSAARAWRSTMLRRARGTRRPPAAVTGSQCPISASSMPGRSEWRRIM